MMRYTQWLSEILGRFQTGANSIERGPQII